MARGGARIGAGRPKKSGKAKPPEAQKSDIPEGEPGPPDNYTPLEYMLRVMNNPSETAARRAWAAQSAAPYCHPRKGEGAGKKEEKADRARSAGSGKYAASPPPLRVIK